MWLEVEYLPTSLFSFKDINATNTAATSLLFPTPFGVKMGLIGVAIQNYDLDKGEKVFKIIRDREIRFDIPRQVVINKTFGRITAISDKSEDKLGNNKKYPKPSYREYVFLKGNLKIALDVSKLDSQIINLLKKLFIRINYFGKKGSFMQFKSFAELDELPENYLNLMEEQTELNDKSIVQLTEDIPPEATFAEINIYNREENLKRKDNKRIFTVSLEQALSGEGYQYYKVKK